MKNMTTGPEGRYAKALFDLSLQADMDANVASAKMLVEALSEGEDLQKLLADDVLSTTEKKKVLLALAEKTGATKVFSNFLSLLADKKRANILLGTLNAYLAYVEEHAGVTRAQITSAAKLTEAQRERVFAFVEAKVPGTKEIVLDEYVDESLMAGVQVRIGTMQYDASVKARLNGLRSALSA